MIHTDGKQTVANAPVDVFAQTRAEIQSLPTFDESAAWEDEHRYDHDEDES